MGGNKKNYVQGGKVHVDSQKYYSTLKEISIISELQRENIEVKPLMHAFEWATEPDWVCAPARNTDGKYIFKRHWHDTVLEKPLMRWKCTKCKMKNALYAKTS